MILVLTDQFDVHADKVVMKIQEAGSATFRLNIDIEALNATTVHFDGNSMVIAQGGATISTEAIRTIWMRRSYVEIPFEMQSDAVSQRIWKGEWNKFLSGLLYLLRNARWMNDPRRAFPAENKYLQMAQARSLGFLVPSTIVSNDITKLTSFVAAGPAIAKMMSQQLFRTEDGVKGIYANLISVEDLSTFRPSGENPLFIQQYVEKDHEVRYTVVGGEHFACRIDSQASDATRVDWRRYDLPRTPHSAIKPPIEVRRRVDALMGALGLVYGALDFVVAPDGRWYFLEVNPMGQWLWIEDLAGLPISDAIADWLRKG